MEEGLRCLLLGGGGREGSRLQGGRFEIRLCRKEAESQWSLSPHKGGDRALIIGAERGSAVSSVERSFSNLSMLKGYLKSL